MHTLTIKDHKVLKGLMLVPFHLKMIALLTWIYVRYSKVVITSAYRKGDSGVHGTIPCRGIDIRSWVYDDPQKIIDDINAHWIYDDKRPEKKCAILHDSGQGEHVHLQCSNRTKYIKE